MTIRKSILTAALVAACLTGLGGVASAQTYGNGRYPVCLQLYVPYQAIECAYTSIPQCQATASGLGAQCYDNPFYRGQDPRRSGRRGARGMHWE